MKKLAAVLKVTFKNKYKRVIAVSDIHGDYDGFIGLLKQLDFNDNDALVIVGDTLEKGYQSLQLIEYIMSLNDNVYVLKGNNDALLVEWFDNEFDNDALDNYLQMRYDDLQQCIIGNIIVENQLGYESPQDLKTVKEYIHQHYQDLLDYLINMPDIIDSDIATFVHAGLDDGKSLDNQDYVYAITVGSYGHDCTVFHDKPVVVGHWPVSNYSNDKITIGIDYNPVSNVYSIDGGNSMKSWGQLNALIFDLDNNTISYQNYDRLPFIELLQDNIVNKDYMTLIFPHTRCDVLEEKDDLSYCHFLESNSNAWVKSNNIYIWKGQTYCMDTTTYYLPLYKGDIVKYCETIGDDILVKKDNQIGLYRGQYKRIEKK